MNKEIIAKKIYQTILNADNILLVTHYGPDGDALASLGAMMLLLNSLGKKYLAWCADQVDPKFAWLPAMAQVASDPKLIKLDDYQLIISLDCGNLSRTRLTGEIKARRSEQIFVEIDHHEHMEEVADLELRLPQAASTTEVLYDFFKINRLPITPAVATCFLAGILTDTGNFFYSSTSDKVLRLAAEMLTRGATLTKSVQANRPIQSLAAIKLWGLALARLQINRHYQVAWTVLHQEDFLAAGANEKVTEELAGWLSRLGGVKAVLLLKEGEGGIIKGSWRACQEGVNVARLAGLLGGGGHAKAAGFHFNGQLKLTAKGWIIE